MAFVLKKQSQYKWPVKFKVAVDGGVFEESEYTAVFRRIPMSKINELLEEPDADDVSFALEVVVGFEGVSDDSGPVQYSEQNLLALLDFPGVANATTRAYLESIKGQREKN